MLAPCWNHRGVAAPLSDGQWPSELFEFIGSIAIYKPSANQEMLEPAPLDVVTLDGNDIIPTLLQVLCETSGLRFAAVARVADRTWTACVVVDHIELGIQVGSEFNTATAPWMESRAFGTSLVFARPHADAHDRDGDKKAGHIESCISVPIMLDDGLYFGNLCAIDPTLMPVSDARLLSMFVRFAFLIARQIDSQRMRKQEQTALLDERAAGELREQFIAILGHDLRTPLQSIYATGELLERRLSEPGQIQMTSRIRANVRRMSALIDDVLDFAKGRLGGGLSLQMSETGDLSSGLLAIVSELRTTRPDRQIYAHIDINRAVYCDIGRVQQIASNLIFNALTHSSPSSPVRVSAGAVDDYLVLQVWNEGEPIPIQSIEKIFEPFWRQSTSADRQGLGLGLHICSQIVRAHGGKIAVTSTQADGTQFTVRLPLRATAIGPAAAAEIPA